MSTADSQLLSSLRHVDMTKRHSSDDASSSKRSKAYAPPPPPNARKDIARSVQTTRLRKTAHGKLGSRAVSSVTSSLSRTLAPQNDADATMNDAPMAEDPNLGEFFVELNNNFSNAADDGDDDEEGSAVSSLNVSLSALVDS